MSTRIFYTNLIDASGVVFTPSSENATLPASNLADEQMTKVWRTGTSTASEYCTFDLGSATAATSAIIHNHTLTSGDSSIVLRGSTDNFSASNVLVGTFTHSSGTMLLTFNSASYRYWRLAFTKASSGVTRDVGRFFLGTYSTLTALPDYDGFEEDSDNRDVVMTTAGGQTFSESRPSGRKSVISFSSIDQTDKDVIISVRDARGITNTWFIQVDQSGPSEITTPWYVKFIQKPKAKVSGYDSALVWDTKLELQEQL